MTISTKNSVNTNFLGAIADGESNGVVTQGELQRIFRAMLQGGVTPEEQRSVDALVKSLGSTLSRNADDVESLLGRATQLQKWMRDHLDDVKRVGTILPVNDPALYGAAIAKWCDAYKVLPKDGRDFDACRAEYSRMIEAFADSIASRCTTKDERIVCFIALHAAIAKETAQHIGGDTSVEGKRLDDKPMWTRAFTGDNSGKFAGDCTDFAELGLEIGRYFSTDFTRVSFVQDTANGQLASQQHSVAAIIIDGTVIGISNHEARRLSSSEPKSVLSDLTRFAADQTKIAWHGGQVLWKS